MKNLKKLSREATSQIKGGGFQRCSETDPCPVGWCCNGMCKEFICIE
ncbi:hypothetical protein [Chryseobacterium phosphatilyticum]|nr:hypothetical protein [Chryseobacterium phosphatilyticum]